MQALVADEARRILNEAKARGILLRLFGGVAVKYHCPSANHRELQRNYPDLDFFGTKKQGRPIRQLFTDLGYQPNQRFNALHGDTRLIFDDPVNNRSADIFLEVFRMCHIIPIGKRLALDEYTIPITDLLLTKLQIVELNEKDVRDLTAILIDHEVGGSSSERDKEFIDAAYIGRLCSDDWGLQKTISLTLGKVTHFLSQFDLQASDKQAVEDRIKKLLVAIDQTPKSLKWKLRDAIGEKKRWYDLPEAPIRTQTA